MPRGSVDEPVVLKAERREASMGCSRSVVRLVGAALLQGAQCLRDGRSVVGRCGGARLRGCCCRYLPWTNRREGFACLPLNVVDQPAAVVDLDIDKSLAIQVAICVLPGLDPQA